MVRVAEACRDHGASRIFLAATHGLFSEHAGPALSQAPVERIVVTNTVAWQPPHAAAFDQRLAVIDVAGVFAEAIRRCHTGGSINELLGIEDLPQP
jgi:ribose-phosphate pyrophosphokinase